MPDEQANPWWVDDQGCVAGDLPCLRCGYNLRTLAAVVVCPECGTPVRQSAPLNCRGPRALRRLQNAIVFLILAGVVAVFLPHGYTAFLDAFIPESPAAWQLSLGETINHDPWYPWNSIAGWLANYGTMFLVYLSMRLLHRTLLGLDLPIPRAGNLFFVFWWAAASLLAATVLFEIPTTLLGGPSTLIVPRAGLELAGQLAITALAVTLARSLGPMFTLAGLRQFGRGCSLLIVLYGLFTLVQGALLLVAVYDMPQIPDVHVIKRTDDQGATDYLIFDFVHRTTARSTTAPADALAASEAHLEAIKRLTPSFDWAMAVRNKLETWLFWPGVGAGILMTALLAALSIFVHRALLRQSVPPT